MYSVHSCVARPVTYLAIVLVSTATLIATAQEQFRADGGGAKTEILLMNSGRIITGRVIANGDDFTVQLPAGQMFVPGRLVRMRCDSLQHAYDRMHDEMPDPYSPGQHITLAKWCFANHLLAEARRELKDALHLDPAREEARDLLRRVEDTIEKKNDPPAKIEQTSLAEKIAAREDAEPAESLGGLSADTAQQFVRRIQPILMNNCAVAQCHGPRDESSFRLERATVGTDASRHTAERNLAAVVRHLDHENPRASGLLAAARGNHGRRGKPLFAGTRGADQLDELRKWVLSAGKELTPTTKGKSTAELATSRSTEASSKEAGARTKPAAKGERVTPAEFEVESTSASAAARNDVVPPKPTDPFDPAEFNRGGRK